MAVVFVDVGMSLGGLIAGNPLGDGGTRIHQSGPAWCRCAGTATRTALHPVRATPGSAVTHLTYRVAGAGR